MAKTRFIGSSGRMLSCGGPMRSWKRHWLFRSEARPPTDEIIRYVDMFRGVFRQSRFDRDSTWGYRLSCFTGDQNRAASQRTQRNAASLSVTKDFHQANYGVYGVRKTWQFMARARWVVVRYQVANLMP